MDAGAARPAYGSRIPGVEGLRAISAAGLVVWHTYVWAGPDGPPDLGTFSTYGVPQLQLTLWIFFCLSAFLLYRPFAAAIIRGGRRPSFGAYLENRVLRIVPAYWFILAVVTFVMGVALVRVPEPGDGPHLLTFIADLGLVQNYHPSGVLTGIAPTWSLAVEAVFYAVLPLLVLLATVLARPLAGVRSRALACCAPAVLLLLVGVVSKHVGHTYWVSERDQFGFSNTWFAVWERSFLSQADLFAFGLVLAVLFVLAEDGRLKLSARAQPVLLALAAAILVAAVAANERGNILYHRYTTVIGVVAVLLVAAVVLVEPAPGGRNRLVRVLESRPFRWSGLISYSVFLWHYPVANWLRELGVTLDGRGGFAFNLVLVAAVTWALSAITYRYVELPFLRRKRRRRYAGGGGRAAGSASRSRTAAGASARAA